MKNGSWWKGMAVAVSLTLLASCGGGGGNGNGDIDVNVCGGATKGCIAGSIKTKDGTAISNAEVTIVGSGASAMTKANATPDATANEQGWYTADNIEEGNRVICFSADGYVKTCRTVAISGTKTTPITPMGQLTL